MNKNRRISIITKGLMIFTILFYFIYFACYTCSGAGGANGSSIMSMHYDRGIRFYKQGEYDKAINELESVLYIDPTHKKAKKYMDAAIKKRNKKIVNKLYRQASAYYKQKQYEKALSSYQDVLKVIPDDGYALYKIELLKARIEKAEQLDERDKHQKRTEELEKLVQEGIEKEKIKAQVEELDEQRRERDRKKQEAEEKKKLELKGAERKADIANQLDDAEELLSEDIQVALPAISVFSEPVSAGRIKPREMTEKEKIRRAKSLYVSGKQYYSEGHYYRAISTFQQVVDSEFGSKIVYTPYAERYIERAKKKIQQDIRIDKVQEVEDIEDEMINKVIDAARISAEPTFGKVVKDVVEPIAEPESDIRKKLEIPVNMDFQNVDVVYILDYLSDVTGANIVMSSAVTKAKRTVSIKVKDMPLKEALKYVLKSAGLNYRVDRNVIWIATPDEIENEQMETKVFTLEKGKGAFTQFSSATTGGVGLGSAADVEEEINIKDIIEKAVSWPAGSKIVLDERLGALIVTNTPYNIEIIEKILEKIDVEPIQVLIETRFLEVTVTDLSELGIDWELNSDLPIDKTGVGMVQGISDDSGVSFTDTTRQTEGFNLTYQGVLTKPQFQFVLHALEESQKVKTLSAPRVTTLDNQMATMKVVDEWIYPTRYEFQIVQNDANGDGDFNDANETQYQNVPADFVKREVGILLRVTPSVGIDDETITLMLIPEVSEGTAGYFSYAGDVTLPLFTSRNLSTSVVVNNGDTVILGGLIKETRTKVETKVPILGDLPWVGAFFRKDTESTVRKNLLIFVTASILSSSGKEVVINRIEAPVTQ